MTNREREKLREDVERILFKFFGYIPSKFLVLDLVDHIETNYERKKEPNRPD